ncbi:MAG TPA: tryptophan--tRNA ligase [Nocardioidaceae bacterium]|nr:tryptophan--tRNA ligase [Nocardioidaceae bacterium]
MTVRVFTGLKPTGRLQLGNYLGAIRPLLELASDPDNDVLVSVVDLHALTVEHDPAQLREHTFEMAATLLACGLDPRARLFVQSSVPLHTELSYLLESTASYGEMRRMVQFKDKSQGQDSTRLSLLTYPTLMAADILAYRTQIVPVGEDQRQHLELTRTLAERFNGRYGPVFTVPRGVTPPEAARVKDLREPTVKMGKSGADGRGVVFLMDSPDTIAAKVRRAVTDTEPELEHRPGERPGVSNLATILGALTGRSAEKSLEGVPGAAALKKLVTEAIVETLVPIQDTYRELAVDRSKILADLSEAAGFAAAEAAATVRAARQAIGLMEVRR